MIINVSSLKFGERSVAGSAKNVFEEIFKILLKTVRVILDSNVLSQYTSDLDVVCRL